MKNQTQEERYKYTTQREMDIDKEMDDPELQTENAKLKSYELN